MAKPIDSTTTIQFKSDITQAPLTPEELLDEEEAIRQEEEDLAREEAEAEEAELNSPLDQEDQDGWEDNIERWNDE